MKNLIVLVLMLMPVAVMAQTQSERVAQLQAEAAAKAKAAQEAAEAAQKAAQAAQEAADAAAKEAERLSEMAAPVEQPAQQTQAAWSVPTVEKVAPAPSAAERKAEMLQEKATKDAKYLVADAVPVVDGDVQWEHQVDVPGKSAADIYGHMLKLMTRLTQGDNQLERSKVALVNESEHSIIATMQEWLVFSSSALSLDRTKMSYVLVANCSDGHVQVLLNRISYDYSQQTQHDSYKASDWIVDKAAVNKKHTKLYPISGKFRRKTIDRKDEIFRLVDEAMKF